MRIRLSTVALWLASGFFALLLAQTRKAPEFEVTSVRSNKSTDSPTSRFPLGPGGAYVPGNLFSAENQPLIAYVRFAFKLSQGELLDLPSWVYEESFDITARAAANPTKDDMRLMMRSLLIDRFKLRTHVETRSKPAFNLVLARPGRMGPQLKADNDGNACGQFPTSSSARAPESPPTEPSSKSGLQLPPIPCGAIGQITASAPPKGVSGAERSRLSGLRVSSRIPSRVWTGRSWIEPA